MTDIVERLRWSGQDPMTKRLSLRMAGLHAEAADEIVQLRERIRQLTFLLDQQLGTPCEQIRHEHEVERLRSYLLGIAQGTNEEWTHDWALRAIETSDPFEQPKQTEDEDAEAMDNGRNTGGKSY